MTLKFYPNNNKIRITRTKGIEAGARDRAILKDLDQLTVGFSGVLAVLIQKRLPEESHSLLLELSKTQLVIRQNSAMAKHGHFLLL